MYRLLPQEEALQAFIQPETLDGPNQYFCERCKKKCDARKVSTLKMWCGSCVHRIQWSVIDLPTSLIHSSLHRVWDFCIFPTCWHYSWSGLISIIPLCIASSSMTAWLSQRSLTWVLSLMWKMRYGSAQIRFFCPLFILLLAMSIKLSITCCDSKLWLEKDTCATLDFIVFSHHVTSLSWSPVQRDLEFSFGWTQGKDKLIKP